MNHFEIQAEEPRRIIDRHCEIATQNFNAKLAKVEVMRQEHLPPLFLEYDKKSTQQEPQRSLDFYDQITSFSLQHASRYYADAGSDDRLFSPRPRTWRASFHKHISC